MNSSPTTNIPRSNPLPVPSGFQLRAAASPREKITVHIAAKRLGVSRWTVCRLLNSHLIEFERPSERKILIYADSLEAHRTATADPAFWDQHRLAS